MKGPSRIRMKGTIRTCLLLLAFPVPPASYSADSADASPKVTDSDGDGFADVRERNDGTDPSSADSFGGNGLQGVVDGKAIDGWVRVYAPRAAARNAAGDASAAIHVRSSSDNWQSKAPLAMETNAQKQPTGYWKGAVPGLKAGSAYKFVITSSEIQNEKWVSDPRTRVFSGDGRNAVAVDPGTFVWKSGSFDDSSFGAPALGDLMIYEIHVGSMTLRDGKYGGFNDLLNVAQGVDSNGDGKADLSKIDWIKSLGFNAIEVMPVVECATSPYTLGFNPLTFFTLKGAYLDPAQGADTFRNFVLQCHRRGLAVILDVNVNHLDDSYYPEDKAPAAVASRKPSNYASPLVQFDFQNRLTEPNNDFGWMFPPYIASHPDDQWMNTAWGPSVNLTGTTVDGFDPRLKAANQAYAGDSLRMWVNEYHVDGLRFDAIFSIGGKQASGMNGKEFLHEFMHEMKQRKPGFIAFSENYLSVRAMQDQLGMSANWPNPEGWEMGRDDEHAVFPDLAATRMRGDDIRRAVHGMMFWHVQKHDANPWTSPRPDHYVRYPSLSNFSSHNTVNDTGSSLRRVGMHHQEMPESWKRRRTVIIQSMAFLGTPIPYAFMGEEFMNSRYRPDGRGELGAESDWNDSASLPWELAGARGNVVSMWRELTKLRKTLPALRIALPDRNDTFHQQLAPADTDNEVVVIHRKNETVAGSDILIVIRFSMGPDFDHNYTIGCPAAGLWREVFRTTWFQADQEIRNSAFTMPTPLSYYSREEGSQGMPASLAISLPPHCLLVLKREEH